MPMRSTLTCNSTGRPNGLAGLSRDVSKSDSGNPKVDTSLEVINRSFSRAGLIAGSFDPEFQRAKQKSQSVYSVRDLLKMEQKTV